MNRRSLLSGLIAMPVALLAKEDPWKEGRLVAVEVKDLMAGKKLEHRYLCTVSDGAFNYVVEYEKPLKSAVNDPIKFEIKKNTVTVVDADGKKRSAQVEKRERVAAGETPR
jgi:hypothetical protein